MSKAVFDRARAGDEQAFRELTEPFRSELQLHCYRMLGSLADAEDMLQETLLSAWRNLDSVTNEGSLRAWLYRIATNRCLNELRAAKRRRPPEPVPPFTPPEPTYRTDITWLQPYPDTLLAGVAETVPGPEEMYDTKETVRLAFIASLQHLPPRQAAVLVLRDVLGFTLSEVAAMLDVTTTAAKGALQRARATLSRRNRSVDLELSPHHEQEHDVSQRFAEAFSRDDVDGVVALLSDRAWLAMPPAPHQYYGVAAISEFLRASAAWRAGRHFVLVPTRANQQPAFGSYLPRLDENIADAVGVVVLTTAGGRIDGITHFLDADLQARFGLPATVSHGGPTVDL
ncbi:RNA polymerase subunit sigma-70 [Phytoactinopolyspora limicola]|uniref:RNA polymerase subunit sigma-70 n=1 Tax=Phytoactinopolyspora limicola TaxID=2715536 RepID=UPI001409B6C4|nr:RNA polymerase subunit sigma-70 [Phytoactinopolyspora limicola]